MGTAITASKAWRFYLPLGFRHLLDLRGVPTRRAVEIAGLIKDQPAVGKRAILASEEVERTAGPGSVRVERQLEQRAAVGHRVWSYKEVVSALVVGGRFLLESRCCSKTKNVPVTTA